MARSSVSGFPELLPEERLVEMSVLDTLRRIFELHGFSGIETRAVEPLSALEAKGETSKQVYLLERLQGARQAAQQGRQAKQPAPRDLGLHFDLTVPLARYILENANDLQFPVRRYQIQKVWRGERPQEGRFREFTQADVDVIGSGHLAFHHEVEVAQVMLAALDALGIPPVLMEVNNRRLLQGLLQAAGIEDFEGTLRALDKLDKIGADGVREELYAIGLTEGQSDTVIRVAGIQAGNPDELREKVGALGLSNPLAEEGLEELCQLLAGASATAPGQVRASLRIARGLDYYTGSVYETTIPGFESLGSICSGGRYDTLATKGRRTYPGVGLSVGVSRLVELILSERLLVASRPTPSCVFVVVPSEEQRFGSEGVARKLRSRGIPCELSAKSGKLRAQLDAANKRGVPYVWLPGREGGEDQVKDLRDGTQVAADADTWMPPEGDLQVRVTPPRVTPPR